jgi:hypothetical protein
MLPVTSFPRALDSIQIRWCGYVVDVDGLLACRDIIVALGRTKESAFHSPKTIFHARHSFGIYMFLITMYLVHTGLDIAPMNA